MKQTHAIGLVAEILCILRLWLTGWRVLARRWRHPLGEIDLIAARGKTIAFIEVKARRNSREALESIRLAQQQRIMRSAQMWVAKYPAFQQHQLRFDVMWLSHWPFPHRLTNAFDLR
jgi:putative endonuclease